MADRLETPKELAATIRGMADDYPPHLYGGIGHLLCDIAARIDALAGTADPVASTPPDPTSKKENCWLCGKRVGEESPFTNRCWPPCETPAQQETK